MLAVQNDCSFFTCTIVTAFSFSELCSFQGCTAKRRTGDTCEPCVSPVARSFPPQLLKRPDGQRKVLWTLWIAVMLKDKTKKNTLTCEDKGQSATFSTQCVLLQLCYAQCAHVMLQQTPLLAWFVCLKWGLAWYLCKQDNRKCGEERPGMQSKNKSSRRSLQIKRSRGRLLTYEDKESKKYLESYAYICESALCARRQS